MNRLINLFHAGTKDVGANGSGVGGIGGRGKHSRIQDSFFKKVMLGKIISAVCKLYLSPQTLLLIFFLTCYCFCCFMPYNSNLSSRNIVYIYTTISIRS